MLQFAFEIDGIAPSSIPQSVEHLVVKWLSTCSNSNNNPLCNQVLVRIKASQNETSIWESEINNYLEIRNQRLEIRNQVINHSDLKPCMQFQRCRTPCT